MSKDTQDEEVQTVPRRADTFASAKHSLPPAVLVTLSNKLPQKLTLSVDRGTGTEELILPPHGSSAPINEAHLTPYTLGIVEKGYVVKRTARS